MASPYGYHRRSCVSPRLGGAVSTAACAGDTNRCPGAGEPALPLDGMKRGIAPVRLPASSALGGGLLHASADLRRYWRLGSRCSAADHYKSSRWRSFFDRYLPFSGFDIQTTATGHDVKDRISTAWAHGRQIPGALLATAHHADQNGACRGLRSSMDWFTIGLIHACGQPQAAHTSSACRRLPASPLPPIDRRLRA